MAWFSIMIAMILMFAPDRSKSLNDLAARTQSYSIGFRIFDFTFDIGVVCVLIYSNSWVTVAFYCAHILAMLRLREKLDKIRQENYNKQKEIESVVNKHNILF